MELQDFLLKNPKDYDAILSAAPFFLKIQHEDWYVLFKYDQLKSDFSLPIVREARGIIFREDDFKCVRRSFDKFFNVQEPNAAKIDWNTAWITEKVDGSLMCVWYDNGKWRLSTNGQIDAFKTSTGSILYPNFGALFERALKEYNYNSFEEFCEQLPEGQCQTFELCTEENRIVIPYEGFHIYYLGSYLLDYECEQYYRNWANMSLCVELPQVYRAASMEALIERASRLPWDEEGYVVCDEDFNRVKVKSTQWLRAHYTLNNNVMTKKRLLDVILAGEEDEFLVFGEKYREELDRIHLQMEFLKQKALEYLFALCPFLSEPRKVWAAQVSKISIPILRDYLFKYYTTPITWDDYTKGWGSSKWERVLEDNYYKGDNK